MARRLPPATYTVPRYLFMEALQQTRFADASLVANQHHLSGAHFLVSGGPHLTEAAPNLRSLLDRLRPADVTREDMPLWPGMDALG
jgi:hypothetical protein